MGHLPTEGFMSAIDLAVDLASLIEETIAVQKVAVTPGSPAASDKCSAAYVWASRIYHTSQPLQISADDAGCYYYRAYEFRYRIDVCMPIGEGGKEIDTDQFLEKSTELYDYADAVWCAIAAAASAGSLFAVVGIDCEAVTVGELVFSEPIGDRVSAEGYVRVSYPCQVGS